MSQIKLSEREVKRLCYRIREDSESARTAHEARMERFRRLYQRWRCRYSPNPALEEGASNFRVPMLQWSVFQAWARDLDALLGDDAEITAVPRGPTDQRLCAKISRYMEWRVFEAMDATVPLAIMTFQRRLWGRTIAYCPWWQDIDADSGEVWFDGPKLVPMWPDDVLVPAENVQSLHDFSWIIRKYRTTPEEMLARDGSSYQGIKRKWFELTAAAAETEHRDGQNEVIQEEKDSAEGVIYEGLLAPRNTLEVWEWYGKWRPEAKAKAAVFPRELVVKYLPDEDMIVGVEDLAALYPQKRQKRPFVELSLTKDGSYWAAGTGELVEAMEDEETVNHNLMTEGGERAASPSIFYKPGEGWDPETHELEPGKAYPTTDPGSVREVKTSFDPQAFVIKSQAIGAINERVTGLSDFGMGRSIDRPNAPRTATGQVALIEQGNIRLSGLDVRLLREDMRHLLSHVWELCSIYGSEEEFFRVTEEDAGGLFDTDNGFGKLTREERGGRYDFDIRFASSIWTREAKKQDSLALYQLDLQNPLISMNPKALYAVTKKVHAALGDQDFGSLLPEPPEMDMPKPPKEEWTLALQGEPITVNPQDNDELHILDHLKRLQSSTEDPGAKQAMMKHVLEHREQYQAKQLMAQMASQVAETLQAQSGQMMGQGMAQGLTGGPAAPQAGAPAQGGPGSPGQEPFRAGVPPRMQQGGVV